ncbi:MAG: bifunctional nuclease family protein [Phycisphaerales bacterium]|nr:bifunctional nuclease family protein [Phycisphaerales bacterium]
MAVQMELARLLIREMTEMQIIELKERDGERSFPIVIGLPEAFAIERRLKGLEVPRPQTHDLLASVIGQLGGRLKCIHIHELYEGTFYAMLCIEQEGRTIDIDCRPSDAIALSVAEGVPILVSEQVIDSIHDDKQGNEDDHQPPPPDEDQPFNWD